MRVVAIAPLSVAVLFAVLAPTEARADDGVAFFEAKVRPVFVEHCTSCHGAKKAKGGLRLDTADAIRKGGASGPAVTAKDDKALLLQVVAHAADVPAMPPDKTLPPAAVADLKAWVAMGAPLPADVPAKPAGDPRKHWAFQPLAEHAAPKVSDSKWPVTKADSFVLAKLDAQELRPAPAADRRTLIRRVYFDLIGLPPTVEQVEAFLKDTAAESSPPLGRGGRGKSRTAA